MIYSFTGKQYRMCQNNDIYITSEMALVFLYFQLMSVIMLLLSIPDM